MKYIFATKLDDYNDLFILTYGDFVSLYVFPFLSKSCHFPMWACLGCASYMIAKLYLKKACAHF